MKPSAVRITALITLYLAAAVILAEGIGSEAKFLRATSWIPFAVLLATSGYNQFLWRFGPVGPPVLFGTWKVQFVSSWDKEEADQGTRHAYLLIRQTATSLTLTLITHESISRSLAATLERRADGQYDLSWIYENVPPIDQREASPIHFGSALAFGIRPRKPALIEGWYFTDRLTTGTIRAQCRKRGYPASWSDALAAFGENAQD